MTRLRATLAAALAAFALASCGDDQDDAPQPLAGTPTEVGVADESPAVRRFLRRFQEVCVAADRALAHAELEEFGEPGPDNPPPTRAELQRFYEEVVVPARRGELEALARVERPPELEAAASAYLAEHEAATRALGEPLALIRHPGIEDTAFDQADVAATAAGLERCAA